MRTFRLNKLVRDNLPAMMQELGQTVKSRVLDDREYLEELKRKLLEETGEFDPSKPEALKELADIQEVVDALVARLGATPADFKKLQRERATKRGAFSKRYYVETVSMADDDPWVEYYSKEPERFPEVRPKGNSGK